MRKVAGSVLVSDVESWVCGGRLVCIDPQPYATGQAPDRADILNIGGEDEEDCSTEHQGNDPPP